MSPWYAQPNVSDWAGFGATVNSYTFDAYGNMILFLIFIVFFSISIRKGISTAFATGSIFSMIGSLLLLILGWVGPNSVLMSMTASGLALGIVILGGMKDGI